MYVYTNKVEINRSQLTTVVRLLITLVSLWMVFDYLQETDINYYEVVKVNYNPMYV